MMNKTIATQSESFVTLSINETIKDAFKIATKNALTIFVMLILWILTIWIPFVNIGTTIAITLLPIELAKGTVISPTKIFDKKYYDYIGEFILTTGFVALGIIVATFFLVIPGIVLSYTWMFSTYFLIDRRMNPMQAIMASNEATYGNRINMFVVRLVIQIILPIIFIGILILLGTLAIDLHSTFFTAIIVIIGIMVGIIFLSLGVAIKASFWEQLQNNTRKLHFEARQKEFFDLYKKNNFEEQYIAPHKDSTMPNEEQNWKPWNSDMEDDYFKNN